MFAPLLSGFQKIAACFAVSLLLSLQLIAQPDAPAPRIVNIVNFIRLLEPRDSTITEDVLYKTVVKQVEVLKQYHLKGTFLLQYDALMDKRYQDLLSALPQDQFEIGAWWEIPQPLVENSGMEWHGLYPWDWRANIGFSTGYTQEQRIKLIDTYMKDFKKIFGYYPKSVASWFIDAFSINYMYEKYKIVASANCKDQYGTDGYTLWGGYWNQAYYPSKINAYMPAQNEAAQIPVPIFRMLGSDPVRQYDNGLGNTRQGVVTLEPVYKFGGGDSAWVNWFFKQLIEGESLAFAYTQAGQENSFTWKAMRNGFLIQMPLIAKLRDAHKISVQNLAESGEWFKSNFPVTPPTAVTVNKDIGTSDKKTTWYNSRYYRANFIWENNSLRIRDVHLFNEQLPSVYENEVVTENECRFFTLPFVDGYLWSKGDTLAGFRFKAKINGKEVLLKGEDPAIKKNVNGDIEITWLLTSINAVCNIICTERSLLINVTGAPTLDWYIELGTAANASLPFREFSSKQIHCNFENFDYNVNADIGTFIKTNNKSVFTIKPEGGRIALGLDEGR